MDTRLAESQINNIIGPKRFLSLVFFIILIILIIPLYINVFKTSVITKSLFLALEDQELALTTSNVFIDMITFYSSTLKNGNFQVTSTLPTSLKFRVLNSDNQDITTGYSLANNISRPSYIYFNNNKGGNVILQYTNTSNNNFVTRIDIEI